MPSKGTRKQQLNRVRTARRAAAAIAAAIGYPFPATYKRAPNGTYWDGHTEPAGVFRYRSNNEIYESEAVREAARVRRAAHRRETAQSRADHGLCGGVYAFPALKRARSTRIAHRNTDACVSSRSMIGARRARLSARPTAARLGFEPRACRS